jgi:hypothetical protein
MTGRHRTIFLVLVAAIVGCGGSKKEVEHARHSQYDADFAVVYQAALDAVRELYPNIDDSPGRGQIKTAWHQVQMANQNDDMMNPGTMTNGTGMGMGGGAAGMGGMGANGMSPGAMAAGGTPTRLAFKRFYVRFEVAVIGGRPWKVKVIGHASQWDPGNAMPTELHGIARPPWLEPRTQALQVAIWKRIKQFAIPMKEEVKTEPVDDLPKTDPSSFKDIPPLAAKRLAAIKDALAHRDYAALRPQLADDVVWSLGGDPSADTAMAMWQADPAAFEAMTAALASCGEDGKRVTCKTTDAHAYVLVIELRGDTWKVTSFVKPD